jgi:hypothetical protein
MEARFWGADRLRTRLIIVEYVVRLLNLSIHDGEITFICSVQTYVIFLTFSEHNPR